MAQTRTDMLSSMGNEPTVTGKYAVCSVCGVQWQIKSPNNDDAKGCSFCGAGKDAIKIRKEE